MSENRICHYCEKSFTTPAREGPNKVLLFPNGQKLPWKSVCTECLTARYDWEKQRQVELFQEAEARRLWHKEVRERAEARRVEIEARRAAKEKAAAERDAIQRGRALAEMARLAEKLGVKIILADNEKDT